MKFAWRIVREAVNGALRQAAVRIIVALLAGFGAVQAGEEVAQALDPPGAVAGKP